MPSIAAAVIMAFAISSISAVAIHKEIDGYKYIGTSETVVSSYARDGSAIMASYYLARNAATWTGAFDACNSIDMRLAFPMNPAANDELRRFLVVEGLGANAWIGARSTGSTWLWESALGSPAMSWSNWLSSGCASPNSCAYVSSNAKWCAQSCSSTLSSVCQV